MTEAGEPGAVVQLAVYGPVTLRLGGVEVALRKQERIVLASLALAGPGGVSPDLLALHLWGDDLPEHPGKALQVLVSRLRRTLAGHEVVLTGGAGYRLADDVATDLAALRVDPSLDAVPVAAPLLDLEGTSVHDRHARALEEERLAALEVAAIAALAARQTTGLVVRLERVLAERPHDEGLWGHLVEALLLEGRSVDASSALDRATEALQSELGVEPGARLAELGRALAGRADVQAPRPATSFHGRAGAVADVVGAIVSGGLVTLWGPAGVGKSRLAVEAVHVLPDGLGPVRWVDLAAAREPAEAIAAVATAIGAEGDLGAALVALGRCVVVLDHCEHVREAAAALAAQVLATPGARVLATSRQALGTPGEVVVEVGLLSQAEAVELFAARAPVAVAGDDAAAICGAVDPLPLAIELVAAVTQSVSPAQLLTGIAGAPADANLLRGRASSWSLLAAVDWSWDLLSDEAQALLAGLSCVRGSIAVDEIPTFGADLAAPAAALAELAASALVQLEDVQGSSHVRLLGVVAEVAGRHLRSSRREDEWHRAHLRWIAGHVPVLAEVLLSPNPAGWAALDRDHPNIVAGLTWGTRADADPADVAAAAEIVLGLDYVLVLRGRLSESRDLALRLVDHPSLPSRSRACLTIILGQLDLLGGDADAAAKRFTAGLEEAGDDAILLTLAHTGLGILALQAGRIPDAIASLDRALEAHPEHVPALVARGALHRALGDLDSFVALQRRAVDVGERVGQPNVAALTNLAVALVETGQLDEADAALERCLELRRGMGDVAGAATVLANVANLRVLQGRHDEAVAAALEAASTFAALERHLGVAIALQTGAEARLAGGDPVRAGLALAAAAQVRADHGLVLDPPTEAELDALEAKVGALPTAPDDPLDALR